MLVRVSFIRKGGRLMLSYTYAQGAAAMAYRAAADLIEGGKCCEVFVTEVPVYAATPKNPYCFKQSARRVDGEWMVSLTKQLLK